MPQARQLPSKPRTTIALRGTISTPKLQLDHASALALEWARHWLQSDPAAMGTDPLASGVARRAFAVYVQHLQRPDLDPVQEARAVRSACSALAVDAEDRAAAWQRLEDHQAGRAFPSFLDVLHGPDRAARWAAFDERFGGLVQQLTREKSQHMNPRKRSNP